MASAQERMQDLSGDLSSLLFKLKPDVTAKQVHRLRTTIRRMESLLSFAQPDLSRKQEAALDELAGLRKRAGKVRDQDVQIRILQQIANQSTAGDRRLLEEQMGDKRRRQAERLATTALKLKDSNLLAHLGRITARIPGSGLEVDPLREAEDKLAALGARFDPKRRIKPRRLHALRIELKMIRYLAEISEESEERDRFVANLKAVQDALGAWHDWEELTATAEKAFRNRSSCALLEEIHALFTAKYTAAVAAVKRLFSGSSALPARKPPQSTSRRALAQRAG